MRIKATPEEVEWAIAMVTHPRAQHTMEANRVMQFSPRADEFAAQAVVARLVNGRVIDNIPGGIGHNPGANVEYKMADGRSILLKVKTVRNEKHRFSLPKCVNWENPEWHYGVLMLTDNGEETFEYTVLGAIGRNDWREHRYLYTKCREPMYVIDNTYVYRFGFLLPR